VTLEQSMSASGQPPLGLAWLGAMPIASSWMGLTAQSPRREEDELPSDSDVK
jgi:hypothetical protein